MKNEKNEIGEKEREVEEELIEIELLLHTFSMNERKRTIHSLSMMRSDLYKERKEEKEKWKKGGKREERRKGEKLIYKNKTFFCNCFSISFVNFFSLLLF